MVCAVIIKWFLTDTRWCHTLHHRSFLFAGLSDANPLPWIMFARAFDWSTAGECVDFDTPLALMDKPDSLLATLVRSTGSETAAELRSMCGKTLHHGGKPIGPMAEKFMITVILFTNS
jgi:hypothetical protein